MTTAKAVSRAVLIVSALLSAAPALAAPAPVVTASGPVQGMVKDGVRQYLGIPYAAPPVGKLRWRPPQAPAAWTIPRPATAFASSCAQKEPMGAFAAPSLAEDCLYLNVYAPLTKAKPRAVMVWLPGGAFFAGAANDYDGAKLARQGDVVLVTLNYRLGALGFLAQSKLDAETTSGGNYGLQDQQFALRWVQDNIARFGGDPHTVTVFGQSAGGSAILALLVSPKSRGLFQRAIIQSGGRLNIPTQAAIRAKGDAFAAAVGCPDQSPSCLRAVPVKTLLDHQGSQFISPVLDGDLIRTQPGAGLASGRFMRVPIMTGFAADEQAFGRAAQEMVQGPLTEVGYEAYFKTTWGEANAARIAAAYPRAPGSDPSSAQVAVAQGSRACVARAQMRAASKWTPTYAYEFDDITAPSYFPKMSFPMRAYHTAELQYLFPLFHGGLGAPHPLNARQEKLSDQMIAYWAAFARTGDPNTPGARPWRAYDAKTDAVRSLGGQAEVIKDYGGANKCALWDTINTY